MLSQAYVVAELKSSSKRKWEGENLSFVAGAVVHQNPAMLLKGEDWFSIERYRYNTKKAVLNVQEVAQNARPHTKTSMAEDLS